MSKWGNYCNQILSSLDNDAYYTGELDALGCTYSRRGLEIKGMCPFKHKHASGKDAIPSFTANIGSGVYFCNSCGSKGNAHTFVMETKNLSRRDAWYYLGDALGLERPTVTDSRPDIDPALPALWHKALMESTAPVRQYLTEVRGINDDTLRKFMIGFDGERVTLPVYNEFNELVNIRRYKWNSYEGATKMINYEDEQGNAYGEVRLYGIENLTDDSIESVMLCEGEWDRLVAEQNDIRTVTTTAGAGNFNAEFFDFFRNKKYVYVCYDNDEAGRMATTYFLENAPKGPIYYAINWPADLPVKADVTDAFIKFGYNKASFMGLFKPYVKQEAPLVDLLHATDAKYVGKRIKVTGLLAGKGTTPFIYPKTIECKCSIVADGQEPDGKLCQACIYKSGAKRTIKLNASNNSILALIDCTDKEYKAALRVLCGVPQKCAGAHIEVIERGNIETIRLVPRAELDYTKHKTTEFCSRDCYVISTDIPANKKYTLSGYPHPHPNSQQATFIFDKVTPEKAVSEENIKDDEIADKLKIFQLEEGQSIEDKLNDIYSDLERNVTYVWGRREVMLATDLVYNSVLNFYFQGQFIKRGWCETLIIGDSGQAKTTAVERLVSHYRCGEIISGESARRTGLLYSIQQQGSSWTLIWGAMPLNDGGLLVIDEFSGISEDDLSKMSDTRSSGICRVSGVVTGETTARTRLIMISNPRSGRQLRSETYGVNAILKLMGKAEDVRRLDFAVGVASGEVSQDVINQSILDMPNVPHKYTTDLCALRTLWAWSRQPDQVTFTTEAMKLILEKSIELGTQFSSKIPLVEPADQRIKLARLATALACSLYSTEDGHHVIVKPIHVEYIVEYLRHIYCSDALKYDKFSAEDFENSDSSDSTLLRLRKEFLGLIITEREPQEVITSLYQLPYLDRHTLEDATGLGSDELRNVMHFIISNMLVEKAGQGYRRTPLGTSFLDEMLLHPATEEEIKKCRAAKHAHSEI
jgi:hypothetical protein